MPDEPLFSPSRLYRAVMTYLWWVGQWQQGAISSPGGFINHLFYYRREEHRHQHGAGYHSSWRDTIRKHLHRR